MGNAFQSVSTGVAELKNYYQGPIVDQFNEDIAIYRAAERGKHSWSGQQVVRPLKVRRNQGIGATSDGGNLPNIGYQTTVQAQIAARYNYLRFGITGPMIKASQKDIGSFVRAAAFELEQGYLDLKSDVNRQLTWDGTSDLALLNAAAAGSTSIVAKGRESTEPALKFLDVGSVIDIYNGSTKVASGIEITAISGAAGDSTATLTLDQAVTVSENDVIVRSGSYNLEMQGILTQLDGGTSTVFNIARATYPSTQGNEIDKSSDSSTILNLDDLQEAEDEAERRGGQGLTAIYSDYASRRMYQKLLTADKRYVNTMKGDGGFAQKGKSYLEFNGKPWVPDKDCPTRIFFLRDSVKKYVLCELEFADETGSMYIAQSDNDQLEVRLRLFANLFNEMASGCAVIKNHTSP